MASLFVLIAPNLGADCLPAAAQLCLLYLQISHQARLQNGVLRNTQWNSKNMTNVLLSPQEAHHKTKPASLV